MVTPLPILTSLLKLLPWASSGMQQAIHMLFPTLNFTSPYLQKPKEFYLIDKLKYVQIGSRKTSFHSNFRWGLNYEMNIDDYNASISSPYVLMNEFIKVFHPLYPTKECDFRNEKNKKRYWVLDKKIPFYIHPQKFYYIPIPLSHNSTMYVALSKNEIKLDILFSLHKLPHTDLFTGLKLALPLLNVFNDTNVKFASLLHVNPIMKDMTHEERNLTMFRHTAGIQFSSEGGIKVHSLTQLGDFEIEPYQPPNPQNPMSYACEFSRFQVDSSFYILITHSITQAVYFLGHFKL
ncbi:hypothetical protein HMI56_007365 [Coelomomyces lativittatus]|nr:hypothetical protein HMI56_007365 [Coelomomyces lativittatus]